MILYQIVTALALLPVLLHQAPFEAREAVDERLGLGLTPATGPKLWLYAASVGEVTSARWVIEAVMAARPGLQVLVTTNSATGRARVLDRWQPQALVVVENELWPARLRACDNRACRFW